MALWTIVDNRHWTAMSPVSHYHVRQGRVPGLWHSKKVYLARNTLIPYDNLPPLNGGVLGVPGSRPRSPPRLPLNC